METMYGGTTIGQHLFRASLDNLRLSASAHSMVCIFTYHNKALPFTESTEDQGLKILIKITF